MFGRNKGAESVVERLPDKSIGVEIGVWKGDSSELFLRKASLLHLVDPWSPHPYVDSDEFGGYEEYRKRYAELVGDITHEAFEKYYENIYQSVVARFDGFPVEIHRCTSRQFFASFHGSVDWVYVDGGHDEATCYHDLFGSLRIANYAVFGDDYGTKPGVTAAVDRIVAETNCPITVFAKDQYRLG